MALALPAAETPSGPALAPPTELTDRYRPRTPEATVLHRVVRAHLETFLADATRQGGAVPEMVERELRDFLSCGSLARGFARLRCPECRTERLVAFSCKGRGFCPSCMGRRMTELSAGLVDSVIPPVPVRQWVLSLPVPLRYAVAWDHDLCLAVLRVFLRALRADYRRRGRLSRVPAFAGMTTGGEIGTVTVVQRFGGALNLNCRARYLA